MNNTNTGDRPAIGLQDCATASGVTLDTLRVVCEPIRHWLLCSHGSATFYVLPSARLAEVQRLLNPEVSK